MRYKQRKILENTSQLTSAGNLTFEITIDITLQDRERKTANHVVIWTIHWDIYMLNNFTDSSILYQREVVAEEVTVPKTLHPVV
jgi:hypothetical protein